MIAHKGLTTDHPHLDIRWLKRNGYLKPSSGSTLVWSSNQEIVVGAAIIFGEDRIQIAGLYANKTDVQREIAVELDCGTLAISVGDALGSGAQPVGGARRSCMGSVSSYAASASTSHSRLKMKMQLTWGCGR